MDVLKSFLFGRMMWNASLDPDALITQFLERYYGPAAPFVRLYMVSYLGILDSHCAACPNALEL